MTTDGTKHAMWESDGSGGDAGAREDPERELVQDAGDGGSTGTRRALHALRRQVLEVLADLSVQAERRGSDARLGDADREALRRAEHALRERLADLVRDASWPRSLRDAHIVLHMAEVARHELSAARTRHGDGVLAVALLAQLCAALTRAFLSGREVGMD
jgi:hypothetical protein